MSRRSFRRMGSLAVLLTAAMPLFIGCSLVADQQSAANSTISPSWQLQHEARIERFISSQQSINLNYQVTASDEAVLVLSQGEQQHQGNSWQLDPASLGLGQHVIEARLVYPDGTASNGPITIIHILADKAPASACEHPNVSKSRCSATAD